jgi:SAM-dependent methyltransferase
MCSESCIIFGFENLKEEEIKGKRVIEVGSYYVNGSLRSLIQLSSPSEYIGVDIEKGPGVDLICQADNLIREFGRESFDIVISTEMLEHVKNWSLVISNLKNLCRPGGIILITTRSYGFGYHAFPYDFWRYELEDVKAIFEDCEILKLEKDPKVAGVFFKIKKPDNFIEKDLSHYKLYNIIVDEKVDEEEWETIKNIKYTKWQLKRTASSAKWLITKVTPPILIDVIKYLKQLIMPVKYQ